MGGLRESVEGKQGVDSVWRTSIGMVYVL